MLEDELLSLTEEIKVCDACSLKENRTQVVPGIYGPKNSLCFIGEAPGFNEDRQGLPFVGRSGKILDNILADIGLKREECVSILNVIKCRPTTKDRNNRTPTDSELLFCGERWLFKQLAILKPKLIVTLGGIALKFFIPSASVTKYAGQAYDTDFGIKLFVTYHPAYILRNYNLMEEYNQQFESLSKLYKSLLKDDGIEFKRNDENKKSQSEQKSLSDFFG